MHPGVVGVPHRVEHADPRDPVVGHVQPPGRLQVPGAGDHGVRLELPDPAGDVAPDVERVDQHAVGVIEHHQFGDADLGAGPFLLATPDPGALVRRDLHAGLALGQQQVRHLDAPVGPFGDGRGRAVLQVVRVRHHAQHPPELLVGQPLDAR